MSEKKEFECITLDLVPTKIQYLLHGFMRNAELLWGITSNNSPYYKPYDKEGGFLLFTCRCDTYINKLGLDVKQMEDFIDDEDITFQQAIIQDT